MVRFRHCPVCTGEKIPPPEKEEMLGLFSIPDWPTGETSKLTNERVVAQWRKASHKVNQVLNLPAWT